MATAAKPKKKHKRSLFRLIPRHGAFPIAAVVGAIAYVAALLLKPDLSIGIGANALFVVYLGIVFFELPRLTPEVLKENADQEDPPIVVIMLVTIGVVAVAAFSLFVALNGGDGLKIEQVVAGIVSVVLGWFVVHTMAALHYAYEYYESPSAAPRGKPAIEGGLEWPAGDKPNAVAFLYLSYQLGAALQIADVPATSNKMRGLILGHTVFSFFYNTMLVTAGVNVVVIAAGGGG